MSRYRYKWASDLFDWTLLSPEADALLLAVGCVLGFAVALWELSFHVEHRARWLALRTLAGRRRLRQKDERARTLIVSVLRRRLARLEGQHAY